jgi:hypothetical protein
MRTKSHYLTVRCPFGCEAWLHPKALRSHESRCARHQWTDAVADGALVADPLASLLRAHLAPDHCTRPTFSSDRILKPGPSEYLYPELLHGAIVHSPIPGVPARTWAYVVAASTRMHGESVVSRAMEPAGFRHLEAEVQAYERFTACDDCGTVVTLRGLRTHRASSSLCRWQRAVTEVTTLWDAGHRDPWSLRETVPLNWGELNRFVAMRRRLTTVRFPRWTAVLVAPEPAAASVGS